MSSLRRLLVLVSIVPLLACGGAADTGDSDGGTNGGGNGGDWAKGEQTVDVTWGESTEVVDESAMDDLVERDEDGTFVFRKSAAGIADVASGDVVIFSGVALRRVDSVTDEGERVRLETSFATLPEAIEEGTIAWDRGIDWGDNATGRVQGLQPETGAVVTRRGALISDGLKWSGEIEGYDVELKLEPTGGGDRLKIFLSMTKNPGGTTRSFGLNAEGWISRFRSGGNVDITGHSVEDFRYRHDGLKAEMKVTAAGVELGEDNPIFAIPIEIEIPFRLGPIPGVVKVKAAVRMVAQLQVPNASSQIEVTFEYDADYGVRVRGGGAAASGGASNTDIDIAKAVSAASGGAAGVGIGVEAPRVEVGFFGETLVPYITVDHFVSSVWTFLPACQEVKTNVKAVIGLNFSILGISLAEPSKEIFREEETKRKGEDCPEE